MNKAKPKNILLIIVDNCKLRNEKLTYIKTNYNNNWIVLETTLDELENKRESIKQELMTYQTIYVILRISSAVNINGDLETNIGDGLLFSDILHSIFSCNWHIATKYHIFAIDCRGFFLHKGFTPNLRLKSIITLTDYCSGVHQHNCFRAILESLLHQDNFSFRTLVTTYLEEINPYVPVIFISYLKENKPVLYTPLTALKARYYANPLYKFYITKDYESYKAFINVTHDLPKSKIDHYFKSLMTINPDKVSILRNNPLLYREPYTFVQTLDYKELSQYYVQQRFEHNSDLYIQEPSYLYYEHLEYYSREDNIISKYIDKDIISTK